MGNVVHAVAIAFGGAGFLQKVGESVTAKGEVGDLDLRAHCLAKLIEVAAVIVALFL